MWYILGSYIVAFRGLSISLYRYRDPEGLRFGALVFSCLDVKGVGFRVWGFGASKSTWRFMVLISPL